jgi:hypothetical protein
METSRSHGPFVLATAALLMATLVRSAAAQTDPWLDGAIRFTPGAFAGFGAAALPRIVLGPPHGGGLLKGSTHVVSLGNDGSIVVTFRDNVVVDEPGDDLVIFENAFHSGSEDGPIFDELGIVAVSTDGLEWHEFPYDAGTGEGLAGRAPVLAAPGNGIDPLAPEGGGDRFDIGALGLSLVRFVRITDGGAVLPDAGNNAVPADKGGFDLDAMGAIHSSAPGVVTGTVVKGGAPVSLARVRLIPADGTRTLRKRTHADGTFRIRPVLPSGSYRVVARLLGLGRAEQEIEVSLDHLEVDVELALE